MGMPEKLKKLRTNCYPEVGECLRTKNIRGSLKADSLPRGKNKILPIKMVTNFKMTLVCLVKKAL